MIRFITFLLCAAVAGAAPTYTEFYVKPATGSNLNAGSSTGSAVTYASGSWVASTGVFTVASGDPTSNVTVGEFASVYADGASYTDFVGRVTARTSTTITVSLTAAHGTAPTNGTSNRTIKIGGPWAGPSGSVTFPFNFAEDNGTDASGNTPRISFDAGTYTVTTTIQHTKNGPCIFRGSGGKAVIQGPATGTRAYLLEVSASETPSLVTVGFQNFIFEQFGNTGSAQPGVRVSTAQTHWHNCVFRGFSGSGIRITNPATLLSCESYGNNSANASNTPGMDLGGAGVVAAYCISHHNTGSNTDGFVVSTKTHAIHCIAWANGRHGFRIGSSADSSSIQHCDAYANGTSGIFIGSVGTFILENNNLIGNGAWGIDLGAFSHRGMVANNGFGSGTAANGTGTISTSSKGIEIVGSVTYPTNSLPWSNAATGNFSIDLDEAKGAGRGQYLYTSGTALTVGTPDIGAAQSSDGGGGNTGPTVTITSPSTGSSTLSPATLTGTATDSEDGTISANIAWTSDVDGALGTGASISPSLTVGTHTITASITDSGSVTDTDSISLTITEPPPSIEVNATNTTATTVTIQ